MADERFATKIQEAGSNEPGLVLRVEDDLSTTLLTPGGKEVPVDLTGGGGGGGTVTSVTAADGTITIGGTAADPTVAVDEIATANIANGAVTAAKVAADVATQAELDAVSTVANAAVPKALYDANTVLAANADDTPAALTMGASTILARLAAGNIKAASVAEILTLLSVPTNAQAVLQALADAKGDIFAATAADTVARVAVGANGTVLFANSAATPGVNWALPPGAVLDRTTYTTNLTSAATTEASATTVMTSGAVSPGAGVMLNINVNASGWRTDGVSSSALINLWRSIDGGAAADLGRIAQVNTFTSGENQIVPLSREFYDTPGAGSIVYTIRLWNVSGTATIFCTPTYLPAALKIQTA